MPVATAAPAPEMSIATYVGAKPLATSIAITAISIPRREAPPSNALAAFVAPIVPLPIVRMSTPLTARTSRYPVGMLPAR